MREEKDVEGIYVTQGGHNDYQTLHSGVGFGVVFCLLASSILSQTSVVNSKHNLSTTTGTGQITDISTNEDRVCVFCHTPHSAAPAVPLWNHSLSAVASYTVYSNPATLDSSPADFALGTAVSNLCMSCHDGTVGVNNLVNPANDTGGNPTMGSTNELDASGRILSGRPTNLGSILSNDHPVNMTFDAALATTDGQLNTPISADFVDSGLTVPLFSSTVQCASCHNPHDDTNQPFLRKSNAGSALCLTCHVK